MRNYSEKQWSIIRRILLHNFIILFLIANPVFGQRNNQSGSEYYAIQIKSSEDSSMISKLFYSSIELGLPAYITKSKIKNKING